LGIIAWKILGLGAGLLGNMLTAIVGAAILLLVFHLFTSRQPAGRGRRTGWARR
jgi:hypothetical protein